MNIYQKLVEIQAKISGLEKSNLNKFQNYKYFTEYGVLKLIRPLLSEQKLTLTLTDEINSINQAPFSAEKMEKEWVVKYLKKAILTNSEKTEEQLIFYFWACGQNTDIAKAKGSAETYATKYFLQKLFLIPTSDNLDPDKTENSIKK